MMKRLLGIAAFAFTAFVSVSSFAADTVVATGEGTSIGLKAALALGAGLGIGIASFGGALGQGKAASAALEGIARNPEASGKVMTPMIIALALIESLVIYSLVIAFFLVGKI